MRVQFDRFRGFVEEFSANLSLGGMFIRTDEPREIGTEMPIEFRLGEDYELIRGKGRVVWVREEGLGEEHPAGMGIRFLELTPGSRELIFKLVERRVREGGELFDLDAEAEILDDLPQRPPDPGPAPESVLEGPATAEPEDSREAGAGEADAGEDEAAEDDAAEDEAADGGATEDEEFDPWEDSSPTLPPPAVAAHAASADPGRFTSAAEPGPDAAHEEREPFYLADPTLDGPPPEGRDETDFSDETFSAGASVAAASGASRAVSPFGTPDAGGGSDAPSLPEAPAATPSLTYTPEDGGAAYDNQEERSFVRRRGLILGLIVVLVFGLLALGWWLLGHPPEMAASGSGATAAAPGEAAAPDEVAGAAGDGVPRDSVRDSDVEGGLGSVRATPPGQEPQRPRWPGPGAGTADEGFGGTAAGDVAPRETAPGPDPGSDPGSDGSSEDQATSGDQVTAGDRATAGDGGQADAAARVPLRIEGVSHQAAGSRTVVIIQASRRLGEGDYSDFPISGLSPRHVVRLLGVEQPLPAGQVTVGTGQVARVRSGLHRDRNPSELHLVLDFNSDTARVTEIIPAGDTLRVVVEEAGE